MTRNCLGSASWMAFIVRGVWCSVSRVQHTIYCSTGLQTPLSPNTEPEDETLPKDVLDHHAMYVGEAEIAAAVTIGELLVVETHEVEDRRMQVVDVDLFSTAAKPSSSVARRPARLHAAAGQPAREAVVVVIPAVRGLPQSVCGRTRRPTGSAFHRAGHEAEIADERCDRPVGVSRSRDVHSRRRCGRPGWPLP